MPHLPTYADVERAAERIAGHAHRTPVMTSRLIDAELGVRAYFKCENLQRAGAFKFRGAYNALSRLTPDQLRAGVVTFSSGNHAQAIALVAGLIGAPATVVMPHDAPAAKTAATKAYGAQVIGYDRITENREEIGHALARERGLTLIPPFDHPDVIAGQGTAVRELLQETGPLDALFVPLGGGGLLSGSLLSASALAPDCAVYGVEPATGDDGRQSLRRGEIVRIDPPETIADGARTQALGTLTFAIIRQRVTDVLAVPDDDIIDAMRLFATRMKLIVEPAGCLGLAGARHLAPQLAGARIGVVLSGGGVDLTNYAALLAG